MIEGKRRTPASIPLTVEGSVSHLAGMHNSSRPKPIPYIATTRTQPTQTQIEYFIGAIEALTRLERERDPDSPLRDTPEYEHLLEVSYVCGFVCSNITPSAPQYLRYTRAPSKLAAASLLDIRKFIHVMVRSERHADVGAPCGGGMVYKALETGALDMAARRLKDLLRAD